MKLQCLQNRGLRIYLSAPPRTPVISLHADSKALTIQNKTKLTTTKFMHRFIYRDNCLYKNNCNNVDIVTTFHAGPMFINIIPKSTKFKKSLCEFEFNLWYWLLADVRNISD